MNVLAQWRWPLMIALAIAALYGAYHHGVSVTNARRDIELGQLQRDANIELNKAKDAALHTEREQQQTIHDLSARYEQELSDARSESDNLRDAVADGRRRLLIQARCPAGHRAVPETAHRSGVGDATAVELDPVAGRAYFRLRDGITSDTKKLMACQQILKRLTDNP